MGVKPDPKSFDSSFLHTPFRCGGCTVLNDRHGDNTFTTTANMVCRNRNASLEVKFILQSNMSMEFALSTDRRNKVKVIVCNDTVEFSKAWNYCNGNSYFKEVRSVFNFCKGTTDCALFTAVDEREQYSVIVYHQKGYRSYHIMQTAFIKAIPWITDNEFTEFEVRLTKALASTSYADYAIIVDEFNKQYANDENRIREMLSGFETAYVDSMIDNLHSEIDVLNNKIEALRMEMASAITRIQNAEAELVGFQYSKTEIEYSIADYICDHKNVELLSRGGNAIKFKVSGFLEYFDENLADIVTGSDKVYSHITNESDKAKTKQIMRCLFVDKKAKIRSTAGFTLDLNSGVSTTPITAASDEIQNPHIYHYGCMGSFRQVFTELMQKKDYVMIFEECATSASSLNFADDTVIRRFVLDISLLLDDNSRKPFVIGDESVSADELLQYIGGVQNAG